MAATQADAAPEPAGFFTVDPQPAGGKELPTSTRFWCEHHDAVQPFQLKELRTQVFDTYAICAALLTTLSSSRFFFDNRDPKEFLEGTGMKMTVHCSFLLQHVHILLASVCTAAGLEAMLVFVLCTMYSRSALAMPQVGSKVFEYFLTQTGRQRANAFKFMLGCGILSSLNLVVNCLTMPTFIMRKQVPALILDVSSMLCAFVVLIMVIFTVCEVLKILGAAKIIFMPRDKLDECVAEQAALLADTDEPVSGRRMGSALSMRQGRAVPLYAPPTAEDSQA